MRSMRVRLIAATIVLAAIVAACTTQNEDAQKQRDESIKTRTNIFAKAERAAPLPLTTNFPLRKALVKMTQRQDLENHPWYVYILGVNGNIIGYYVSQTVPVNACDFLSSTEDVSWNSDGVGTILQAPSLDGIFYGGSGATSGCDAWFFFDYATDALIQIRGVNFFSADQPLRVSATAITVAPTP